MGDGEFWCQDGRQYLVRVEYIWYFGIESNDWFRGQYDDGCDDGVGDREFPQVEWKQYLV